MRYFLLEDWIPLRVPGKFLADVEIYRGKGKWAPYPRLENFAHNGEQVDQKAFDKAVADFDKPTKVAKAKR